MIASPANAVAMRVGLVGCGNWGRHILRDLKSLGVSVSVVATSPESVERARSGGAVAIAAGIANLPIDLDGYVVASPTSLHMHHLEALLGRGRPIFVEKPLSNDVARVHALPDSARDLAFTMQKWRYHPGIAEMARMARSGEFGTLKGIRTKRLDWGTSHHDVDPVWTLLPHDLAITLHIAGRLPPVASARPDPLGPRGCGVIASLADETLSVAIEVSAAHPRKQRSIIAAFERATVELADGWDSALHIRTGNDLLTRDVGNELPLLAELSAFIEHLRGGPPPLTALDEELHILDRIAEIRALAGLDPLGENPAPPVFCG